jgi:hypothetical protein
MGRIILFFFLTITTSASFGQLNIYNCLQQEKFEFVENADLRPDSLNPRFKRIYTGTNTVFRVCREYDCPNYFDEEMAVALKWIVPQDSSAFNINIMAADSLTMPVYYSIARVRISQFFRTAEGYIKGSKMADKWFVEGDINVFYFDVYRKNIEKINFKFSNVFSVWRPSKKKSPTLSDPFW